ncbi:S24/S26 family peptidase [Pedobacter sp. AW31-3R]|uniref:S24/S26 family peptidase n=1 Tax=Pedobacter sp. AW31-3R TaxID=3445781 RepID=UPI003F9F03FA
MPNKLLLAQVLDYIGQGKYVTIRVKGNSMRPFLREGDSVLLKPFELKELCRGVIVLAKMDGQLLLHRVVEYNKTTIWLAGDHNLVVRELVEYADIVATVVGLYRGEAMVKFNQRWRGYLGQVWYLARPLRRLIKKLY